MSARSWSPFFLVGALCASDLSAQSRIGEIAGAVQRTAEARAVARATAAFDETFQKYSKRYFGPAFDWKIFKAQAMAESNLNPDAASHVGARGLMQLMPATYAWIQSRSPELGPIEEPEWNIAAGIQHDRYLWRLWSRDVSEPERASAGATRRRSGTCAGSGASTSSSEACADGRAWHALRPERRGAKPPRADHLPLGVLSVPSYARSSAARSSFPIWSIASATRRARSLS